MIKLFKKNEDGSMSLFVGLYECEINILKKNLSMFIDAREKFNGVIDISILYGKDKDEIFNLLIKNGVNMKHFIDERNKKIEKDIFDLNRGEIIEFSEYGWIDITNLIDEN